MMKKLLGLLSLALLLAALYLGWAVLLPVAVPEGGYALTVGPNRTLGQVTRTLSSDGIIRNRQLLLALFRVTGADRKVKAGLYRFKEPASMLDVFHRLSEGRPDESSLTAIEGWTFRQLRAALAASPDLQHDAPAGNAELMQQLGMAGSEPEGLFFPSTYLFTPGSSELDLYRRAFATMQRQLDEAWQQRRQGLPYRTPYEMLILASLVEKESGNDADRPMVAAVFINRLNKGMRLQTDPTVIYGMGAAYQGKIGKADLQRDTPYNTYTRAGLPPTPIALPGKAALDAAAQPAETDALYFVARGDGRSHFSSTLDEHNQAVRKYILKKGS